MGACVYCDGAEVCCPKCGGYYCPMHSSCDCPPESPKPVPKIVLTGSRTPSEKATYQGHSASEWVSALGDPNKDVCQKAVDALVAIGPESIPVLIKAIAGNDSDVRGNALRAVTKLGSVAKAASPAAIAALQDNNGWVRRNAARALAAIGEGAEHALPVLFRDMGDRDPEFRKWTLEALDNVIPSVTQEKLREAMPVLAKILADPNQVFESKVRAIRALARCDVRNGLPMLTHALANKNVAPYVAMAIGSFGAAARESVPALVNALKDIPASDYDSISQFADAMVMIGDEARPAIPVLLSKYVGRLPSKYDHVDFVRDSERKKHYFAIAIYEACLKIAENSAPDLFKLTQASPNCRGACDRLVLLANRQDVIGEGVVPYLVEALRLRVQATRNVDSIEAAANVLMHRLVVAGRDIDGASQVLIEVQRSVRSERNKVRRGEGGGDEYCKRKSKELSDFDREITRTLWKIGKLPWRDYVGMFVLCCVIAGLAVWWLLRSITG